MTLGVFCYIINLRLDVVLYARVVNGIRKFFYDTSDENIILKLRIRALPQSPQLPSYFETGYFLPVVFVFSVMDTLYFSFASYILLKNYLVQFIYLLLFVGINLFFLFSHFIIYNYYSYHREEYLKSTIFGIDIDGVLNKHREHFCSILYKNTGINIQPDEITMMPVHENPTLGITEENERQVFNSSEYWVDMPAIEDAANIIMKLKNIFKFKIYIFSYRPWPDAPQKKNLSEYKDKFLKECMRLPLRDKLLKWIDKSKTDPLKQITKEWFNKNNFLYNKFIFEKGNIYSSDPIWKFNNRFHIARKKKIRFFVEDDIEKAIKLSYICDVVFLFSQPYNKTNENLSHDINELRKNLPSNIIRVNNWGEIYQQIRRLM